MKCSFCKRESVQGAIAPRLNHNVNSCGKWLCRKRMNRQIRVRMKKAGWTDEKRLTHDLTEMKGGKE